MNILSLNQFLMLYSWFLIAGLLAFLFLIARFYQRFSGVRTYFRFYLLAIVLLGVSSARYASMRQVAGDLLADLLLAGGGLLLLLLTLKLHRLMLRRRHDT